MTKKKKLYITAAVFILGVTVLFLRPFGSDERSERVTWIWDLQKLNADHDGSLVRFLQKQNVRTVYLYFNDSQKDEETKMGYRTFIQSASEAQIDVHALGGERHWALTRHHPQMTGFLKNVIAYNASVPAEARFTGVHLDVEPYLLPEWERNDKKVIQQWMNMMRKFTVSAKEHSLETGVDIPFWLNKYQVPGPDDASVRLDEWMIRQTDSLAIMSYRDRAEGENGLIDIVKHEIDAAKKLGKQVYVGVNLAPDEANHLSFHEEGIAAFKEVEKRVLAEYGRSDAFGGLAVHDLAEWLRMERWNTKGQRL